MLAGVAQTCLAAPALHLSCEGVGSLVRDLAIEPNASLSVILDHPSAAASSAHPLLLIEERGRDLELASDRSQDYLPIAVRPPRLGIAATELTGTARFSIRPAIQNGFPAPVRIRLECRPDDERSHLPQCVDAAVAISDRRASLPDTPGADAVCLALLVHARATSASRASQPQEALNLYQRAIDLWLSAGDETRSAAAMLGSVEQLVRLARFRDAYALAGEAAKRNSAIGNAYFSLRAREEQCLAARSLDQIRESIGCLRPLARRFVVMGEINEAGNALYNMASIAADDGRYADRVAALKQAAMLDQNELSALTRGRLNTEQAWLDLDDGRTTSAVQRFSTALSEFESAKDMRWIADTELSIGGLYLELGASREAIGFASAALKTLSTLDAPQQVARATALLGRIHALEGQLGLAREELLRASGLFASLDMRLAELSVRLDLAEQVGNTQDHDALDALVAKISTLPPSLALRVAFASAERSLSEGHLDEAANRLRQSCVAVEEVGERLRCDALRASLAAARGEFRTGLSTLEQTIEWLRSLALRAGSPALRDLAGRRLLELRQRWLSIAWQVPTEERPNADLVWSVFAATQPSFLLPSGPPKNLSHSGDSDAFNRALAAEFIESKRSGTVATDNAAQKALLHRLATSQSHATNVALPSLANVQRSLATGELLLAYGTSDTGLLVLWVTSSQSGVVKLGDSRDAATSIEALVSLLGNPNTPLDEADINAKRTSEILLPADLPLPRRLIVMLNEQLAAVPYSALVWPGQHEPLVTTTMVSTFATANFGPEAADSPNTIDVLVASGSGSGLGSELSGAEVEPQLIEKSIRPRSVRVLTGSNLNRMALTETLSKRGNWVHVASHGQIRDGMTGYGGLWLDSVQAAAPSFVSWLDLVDQPLAAQLVVLDVCDLAAQRDRAAPATISFATALAAAGAQNVIASLWPVSDAASATWVPAFYADIGSATSGEAAEALRQSQLRLRGSRMFRHPFYWASMAHIQRGLPSP